MLSINKTALQQPRKGSLSQQKYQGDACNQKNNDPIGVLKG